VVVLGGGTAGWMSAAALQKLLGALVEVELVESEDIGIVGVGEATLPHIRGFVERLGIDEAAFMKATHATYKLGIDFRDFGRIGERYVHPFGSFGEEVAGVGFHHYWLEMQRQAAPRRSAPIRSRSRPRSPTSSGRRPRTPASPRLTATPTSSTPRCSDRSCASSGSASGVRRTEGKVVEVRQDPASGDVTTLVLDDGRTIDGDLFIDCSGFRSLMLGTTLGEDWEDWSPWLPCDRAAAMPCAHTTEEIEPYTRASARPAGWQWRIPLQHRIGNGYVFASAFLSEDEACTALAANLDGKPLADPRLLRFRAGRRKRSWSHNVIAVGLASGFLEPLESTSIYLAQMAITYLIELFPPGGQIDPRDRDEFNRLVDMEYDRVRDFLILHYHATTRDDSEFWNHVRTMAVPDSLAGKMALWRETGRIEKYADGLFYDASWIAVYLGQGVVPARHDPRAALPQPEQLARALASLQDAIGREIAAMPGHREYLVSRAERLADAPKESA
jgi:tryptophan halogenase